MFLLKVSEGKLTTLLFLLILTETNCWELLGKRHSTFPSISKMAKHSMCQWMISHCEGSQYLYCRQTLGWPHQFLEHRPCCQSWIPALLFFCISLTASSLLLELTAHTPGGFTCEVLQVPFGWVSHAPHYVLCTGSLLSPYWSKLQKHYSPSVRHPQL